MAEEPVDEPVDDPVRGRAGAASGGAAGDQPPARPVAVDLKDYVDFDLDAPAGRRVLATDVLALDLLCLEPQQVVDPRTFATADAVYSVVAGQAWLVTDEEEVTLGPLQAVLIPAGTPHGLRNSAADPLILQVVTSPPDEAPVLPAGPVAAARQPAEQVRGSRLDRWRRVLGSR